MATRRLADDIDRMLWAAGHHFWLQRGGAHRSRKPHELDYLRAFHSPSALRALSRWLAVELETPVRLQTMWQDKSTYVRPRSGRGRAERELADLAVIVRRCAGGKVQRAMWILQAKVLSTPDAPLSGPASAKEIALFEGCPRFDVLDSLRGRKIGRTIDPTLFKRAQGGNWSFLTYHAWPSHPYAGPGGPYPVRLRWPGSTSPKAPSDASFAAKLAAFVRRPGHRYGEVVGAPTTSEWSALYDILMRHIELRPTSGHARSAQNLPGRVLISRVAAFMPDPRLGVAGTRTLGATPLNASEHDATFAHLDDVLAFETAGDGLPPISGSRGNSGPDEPGPGLRSIVTIDLPDAREGADWPPLPG